MMAVVIVLYVCVEALSAVFCFHYLYGERLQIDKLTVGFILLDTIWMSIGRFQQLGQTWSLAMYPVMLLYCWAKFGRNIKAAFINVILDAAIMSTLQATIMLLFSVAFKMQNMNELACLLINVAMFFAVITGLRKCRLEKLSNILQSSEALVVMSLTVVVASTALFLLSYKQSKRFEVLYYIVLGISLLMIVIAVIDIGKHKIKMKEAEAELHLHKVYEPFFRNLIEDICARQHEFDNHINTIYSQHFLYKTYEELVAVQNQYCKELQVENRYNKLLSQGNFIILGFLYGKFPEIEKRGVQLIYKVNIGELQSSVPVYKIVELLGNLLNNAADAAIENGTKTIDITMLEEADTISIEVKNESPEIDYKRIENFFKKGYSEKGKNRGYGLYNVKKICNEYKIVLSCVNKMIEDKNWLVFNLIINKGLSY